MRIKYLFNALLHCIYTSVFTPLFIILLNALKDNIITLINEININNFSFKDYINCIKLGFFVFIVLIMFSVIIYIISRILYNIYNFWTYDISIPFLNANINIDESNTITSSFIEFEDGTKIPMYIKKMCFNKDDLNEVKNNE